MTPDKAAQANRLAASSHVKKLAAHEKLAHTVTRERQSLAERKKLESDGLEKDGDWTQIYAELERYVDEDDLAAKERKLASGIKQKAPVGACLGDHAHEKELFDMPIAQLIEKCMNLKRRGNMLFREGAYYGAKYKYREVLTYLAYAFPDKEEDDDIVDQLRVDCLLNEARCLMRYKKYQAVAQNCYEVMLIDKDNVKALYQRAQAYRQLYEFDSAKEDVQRALALAPTNRQIRNEWQDLRTQMLGYQLSSKRFGKAMFAKCEERRDAVGDAGPDRLVNSPFTGVFEFDRAGGASQEEGGSKAGHGDRNWSGEEADDAADDAADGAADGHASGGWVGAGAGLRFAADARTGSDGGNRRSQVNDGDDTPGSDETGVHPLLQSSTAGYSASPTVASACSLLGTTIAPVSDGGALLEAEICCLRTCLREGLLAVNASGDTSAGASAGASAETEANGEAVVTMGKARTQTEEDVAAAELLFGVVVNEGGVQEESEVVTMGEILEKSETGEEKIGGERNAGGGAAVVTEACAVEGGEGRDVGRRRALRRRPPSANAMAAAASSAEPRFDWDAVRLPVTAKPATRRAVMQLTGHANACLCCDYTDLKADAAIV
jgi:tetratricopeptide (TPR) repeat protein